MFVLQSFRSGDTEIVRARAMISRFVNGWWSDGDDNDDVKYCIGLVRCDCVPVGEGGGTRAMYLNGRNL